MDCKSKRTRLSFDQKVEVLQDFKNGISKDNLRVKYKISKTCLNEIIRNESDVVMMACDEEFKPKKAKLSAKNIQLEEALIQWFRQKRDMGQPITGPLLQEKALVLNEKLGLDPNFKVRKVLF